MRTIITRGPARVTVTELGTGIFPLALLLAVLAAGAVLVRYALVISQVLTFIIWAGSIAIAGGVALFCHLIIRDRGYQPPRAALPARPVVLVATVTPGLPRHRQAALEAPKPRLAALPGLAADAATVDRKSREATR